MHRLMWLMFTVVLFGVVVFGGRAWVAQDKSRCALAPDYLQPILCKPEVIESLALKKGAFQGPLDVRFMRVKSGDGYAVEMVQLLKPFSYKDSKGVTWDVPEGFISDGASIMGGRRRTLLGPLS